MVAFDSRDMGMGVAAFTQREADPQCAEDHDTDEEDEWSGHVELPLPLQVMSNALAEYEVDALGPAPSIETAAWARQAIATLRRTLAVIDDELVAFLVEALPSDGYEVPGVGRLKAKASRRAPKWDGVSLLKILVAQALDERRMDLETGEMLDREADVVARVLAECSTITNPSHSWRTTALKARHIELDEYVEHGGWIRKVVVA